MEISYLLYNEIVSKLVENVDPKLIRDEYVRKIVSLTYLDKVFYDNVLNKKFNIKHVSYNRAFDIISTANPNFNKYYKIYLNNIEFWISDDPYRHYVLGFNEKINETDKLNIINMLLPVFKSSGFKELWKKFDNIRKTC